MPIDVTCPGCKVRFQVSEKFAGKKGPCPKCKTVIQVPAAAEQVVIHAPAPTGPKDSKGTAVLKPIKRTETKVSTPLLAIVIGAVVAVLVAAVMIRSSFKADPQKIPQIFLVFGAMLLAPPLAWAGYSFLRDDDLEPYTGRSLWLRIVACAAVYALMWGVYYGVKLSPILDGKSPVSFQLLYIVPPLALLGGLASFVSLELSFGNSLLHFGFYLLVTVLLRLLVGLPPM